MDLTPEQIAQIQEAVSELPPAEQEAKARELLATMQPGAQQQVQCPFCLMGEGKLQTTKVYEDQDYLAVLEINPVNPGHVLLFPKRHVALYTELSHTEVEDLSKIAQVLLKCLHKLYPATNVHIDNGDIAGQRFPHIVIHLIPRKQGDKAQFAWQPQKVSPEELAKLREEIYAQLPASEEKKDAAPVEISLPIKKRRLP